MLYMRIFLQIIIIYQLVIFEWSNCTQGDISAYTIAALLIIICSGIFLLSYIKKSKMKKRSSIILSVLSIIIISLFLFKISKYFINTNIKGISLCQGSLEYGGFKNRYGFLELPMVYSFFEYLFAPLCLIAIIFIIWRTLIQLKRVKKP